MIVWPYLTIPLVAWLSAQLLKFALQAYKGRVDFGKLYRSGGMPSGHTALIISITTTLGVTQGIQSPLFGFAACISAIIIYDAIGVRRSAGLQAAAIRQLTDNYSSKTKIELDLGSAKGHTPSEVFAGGCLGLLIALLLTYERSLNRLDMLLDNLPAELAWLMLLPIVVAVTTTIAIRNYTGRAISSSKGYITVSIVVSLIAFLSTRAGVPLLGTWLALITLVTSLPVIGWALHKLAPSKTKRILNNRLPKKKQKQRKAKRR